MRPGLRHFEGLGRHRLDTERRRRGRDRERKRRRRGFDATWMDAVAHGHEVANHTVHHCYFNQACGGAPAGSADAEIDGVTDYIQTTLGQATWTMAYPYGDTGYEAAAKARFCLARGVGGGTLAPSDGTDAWNLPVFAAAGGDHLCGHDDVDVDPAGALPARPLRARHRRRRNAEASRPGAPMGRAWLLRGRPRRREPRARALTGRPTVSPTALDLAGSLSP